MGGETPLKSDHFFNANRKGSKSFRKILDYVKEGNELNKRMAQTKSFHKCTTTEFVNSEIWKHNFSSWNLYSLPNRVKVFLLKYYNNILGIGNRVVHIDATKDPSCTFCVLNNTLPPPLETFQHIFFDCPHVQKIL